MVLDVGLVPGLALLVQEDLIDALERDVGRFGVEEVDCGYDGELGGGVSGGCAGEMCGCGGDKVRKGGVE